LDIQIISCYSSALNPVSTTGVVSMLY